MEIGQGPQFLFKGDNYVRGYTNRRVRMRSSFIHRRSCQTRYAPNPWREGNEFLSTLQETKGQSVAKLGRDHGMSNHGSMHQSFVNRGNSLA